MNLSVRIKGDIPVMLLVLAIGLPLDVCTGQVPFLVKDINAGVGSSHPASLVDANGALFFSARDNTNRRGLWKSDGTEAGTMLVKYLPIGTIIKVNMNGLLLLTARDSAHGAELWKSDGTEVGTKIIKDINSGQGDSNITSFTNVNGTVFFRAMESSDGFELWKSDGSEHGTLLVKKFDKGIFEPEVAHLRAMLNVNGTLFFMGVDNEHGWELWKSDGTRAGTVLVKDIKPGVKNSLPTSMANVNGLLFFSASDSLHGQELWKSDGTEAGTVLVKDIKPGTASSSPRPPIVTLNGTYFFTIFHGTFGTELWKSDGTKTGTSIVKDINPGADGSSPSFIISDGSTLFFAADDGTHGKELWRSDGTEAGTALVKDIKPGSLGSWPRPQLNVNGTIFFLALDGVHGVFLNLWKTNGTEAGTLLLKDNDSWEGMTNIDGTVFFRSFENNSGVELWALKTVSTSVETSHSSPTTFSLTQNYPNPFNPETNIRYSIGADRDCGSCVVRLEIYNLLGELVRVLVDERKAPGEYAAVWDGRDHVGLQVPSGIYIYKLTIGDRLVASKRMLLLK